MLDKDYQLSRQVTYRGMIWLLAAQLVVMLPFAFYLPIWLIPVMLASTYWRIRVIKGHSAQPGLATRMLVVALGGLGVLISGMPLVSLDAMVSFLLLGFAFKSLEVISQRDALVVIFIGYFLVAIQFLFNQSILAGAYGVGSLIVLTGALIANQQSPAQQLSQNATRSSLKMASFMLIQCLPLMILVFVFMPRFSPLWAIPSFDTQAKTGMTDRMSPGDIADLSKSDELAFRVSFEGRKPTSDEMYWRGLVLNHFDGQAWQQFDEQYDSRELRMRLQYSQPWQQSQVEFAGEPIKYETLYEKTGRPWLFSLTPTVAAEGDLRLFGDYRVMANSDIQAPLMVRAVAYPDARRDLNLTQNARRAALQMPATGDPKARALARELRDSVSTDQAYVDLVSKRFTDQPYFYTLHPPLLGDTDTIDKFLFDSMRGFCSHYAGSFVFMMRAVGIPARVVVGYLGGKWNKNGDYLSVHQFDAHAWTEVWLEGVGWKRVDPTAMVAPSRVEGGLEAALEYEGSFLEDKLFSAHKMKWLDGIRQKLDSIQYGWRRWVLGYDGESQANLLKSILDKMSSVPLAMLVGGLFAGIFLLWFVLLGMMNRRNYEAYEHQLYRRFCARLAKLGISREAQQTPSEFSALASEKLPEKAATIQAFTDIYQQLCYVPDGAEKSEQSVREMKRLLRVLGA